jgi:hypothetical protein
MLDRITFEHFFLEVRDDISPVHLKVINPNMMSFFKIDNVYVALTSEDKKLLIHFAINTGKKHRYDWLEKLKKEADDSKIRSIMFYTSVNNGPVHKLAAKWECDLVNKIDNFYADGDDAFVYEYKLV